MRIVHFSDWHGRSEPLPPADLYVCTGDMLPNFPIHYVIIGGEERVVFPGWMVGVDVDMMMKFIPQREVELQAGHLAGRSGYLRACFGRPEAPVVVCRGNHDFVGLLPAFDGGPVFDIGVEPTRFTVDLPGGRLTVGGLRGIIPHTGVWMDELRPEIFSGKAAGLADDLDLLVTHSPPEGILDRHHNGTRLGAPALRSYVNRRDMLGKPLKAHLFGHIHEAKGILTIGETVYSNAATGWNVIDL